MQMASVVGFLHVVCIVIFFVAPFFFSFVPMLSAE